MEEYGGLCTWDIKLLFRGAQVYTGGSFRRVDVLCGGGVTSRVGTNLQDAEARVIDCAGLSLVPGFVDVHTHGGDGVDVNAADAAGLHRLSRFFAAQGTTSWLASVLTDTQEQTLRAIRAVKGAMAQASGAQLLGVHLEGPFLAPEYGGAMPVHLLKSADLSLLRRYMDAGEGAVRYLTVSPEVEGVPALIEAVSGELVVALGHSGASYEQTVHCIDRGARCITHTFNAMSPLHHRHPGILGAALERDVFCEAICDGMHLHPATVRLLLGAKGARRVMAITDSIMAAGLPDGPYKLGVRDVEVKAGEARLAGSDVRAGSVVTTGESLRNIMAFAGCSLQAALPMLTSTPARALGLGQKGRIAEGMDADYVLLDAGCRVMATYVGGRMVFNRER